MISSIAMLVLGFLAARWSYEAWSSARRLPKLSFTGGSNLADGRWRWGSPPGSLRVVDGPEASIVLLPLPKRGRQLGGLIGGPVLGLTGFAVLGAWLWRLQQPDVPHTPVAASVCLGLIFVAWFAGAFGFMFLNAALVAVEIGPDRARLSIRFAEYFVRHVNLSKRRAGRARGKLQHFMAMNMQQKRPWYLVDVGGFVSRRFLVDCDQSEGSWLVEGLLNWASTPP
jgi:hypothetical protein